jgi:hypothetical protein
MFTALATTIAMAATETADCSIIIIFAQRVRGDVAGRERDGVRERQVEVVGEGRLPVGGGKVRLLHLREQKVRVHPHGVATVRRATPVKLPVPQRKDEHVSGPDRPARQ